MNMKERWDKALDEKRPSYVEEKLRRAVFNAIVLIEQAIRDYRREVVVFSYVKSTEVASHIVLKMIRQMGEWPITADEVSNPYAQLIIKMCETNDIRCYLTRENDSNDNFNLVAKPR